MTTVRHPGAMTSLDRMPHGVRLGFEHGTMLVSMPSAGIARVRFGPEGELAPRRSWSVVPPDEDFEPPELEVLEDEAGVTVRCGELGVVVARQDGRFGFRDGRGHEFFADNEPLGWREVEDQEMPAITTRGGPLPPGRARVGVTLDKEIVPGEHYYGFGERTGPLERTGRHFTNWTIDPPIGHARNHDNLYKAHPSFVCVRPGLTWGAFMNSTWLTLFSVGMIRPDQLQYVTLGGELDVYVLLGPDPAGVVEKLTRLIGRPVLPPLWALGYHQSRWGYMTAEEFREIARGFRERDIPLDAIHFDIDHMRGYRDFTWDPKRFPDPKDLTSLLKSEDVRSVTILDPGVKYELNHGYAVADEGVAKGMFIKNPDGSLYKGYCWPDAALFPDFARCDVCEWWGALHEERIESGVDGIWNDMNEPAIFDRPFSAGIHEQVAMPLDTPQGDDEERTTHAEVHNLYGHLMTRATYEGLHKLRPDVRPWILTRSSFSGTQKYSIVWMGDNCSWWEHLWLSLPQMANMGLCGQPHVGVDIGGFVYNCTPELYARWVTLGTFYPFMRTHSAAGTRPQEPWQFGPEVEEIARRAIKLRYRLLPYIYTLAHRAHRTGEPIYRPLVYDFPDDPATYKLDDQIMFGPHLLVAPIVQSEQEKRLVYLPRGTWFDFWTGERIEGPTHLIADLPLGKIGVYVRGGAVLTLGNERRSTSDPLTRLTLEVYPAGESEWHWIEDDGATNDIERGVLCETRVRVSEEPDRLTVSVGDREGPYRPHSRWLAMRCHVGRRPAEVTVGGRAAEWSWDDAAGAAEVAWEDDGLAREVALSFR